MRTVWKYALEWTDKPQSLLIPYKSSVVMGPHIAVQSQQICLWAEVDTDKEPTEYVFYIRGTGHPVPDHVDYLGSVLVDDGQYVWHVFVSQESA